MKVLLDTPIWIWWLLGSERLSPARRRCLDDDHALFPRHSLILEVSLHRLIDVVFYEAVDLLAEILLLSRWRKARIMVSSGILSLIMSMPAKRRVMGTLISASSMAGSQRSYHCCIK
jgi:hypothetical protein